VHQTPGYFSQRDVNECDLGRLGNEGYKELMRSKAKFAGWMISLCWASSYLLFAQSTPKRPNQPITPHKTSAPAPKLPPAKLLNSDQGLAILSAALETKRPGHAGADCSHFVHSIYERAGFPYTYAPSSELYVGTEDFRRVAQPQAGDLVVWHGHAGIVVNPREHTFYSALRSGLLVQAYDSPYWKHRGHPHFLRYVGEVEPPLLTASNRGASLKPARLRENWSRESIPAKSLPDSQDVVDPKASSDDPPVPTLPTVVYIGSARPRAEDVGTAITQAFQEVADALAGRDLLNLYPSLVSFDQFEVKKVQLKGDKGWAEVHFKELRVISSAPGRSKKQTQVQRWNLHRQSPGTWEVSLPGDAVYLPREETARLMARQLANLTDTKASSNSSDDKAQLARWLNVLLADSAGH
jgi:hypothetical protein